MGRTAFDRLAGSQSLRMEPPGEAPVVLVNPIVTTVDPDLGDTAGGIEIEITGLHFKDVQTIELAPTGTGSGTACTSVVVHSDTFITCTTPALANGMYDLIIASVRGICVVTNAFEAFSPLDLGSDVRLWDLTTSAHTLSGNNLSQLNDRSAAAKNMVQGSGGFQPPFVAGHFGREEALLPSTKVVGTSGGGASGSLMALASPEATSLGWTKFWIGKTLDARALESTNGNVPNSVIGDAQAGGWSGNAGYSDAGKMGFVNWDDGLGGFRRLAFGSPINDGLPHLVVISHDYTAPYAAEGYLDGVRQTSGTINLPGATGASPQATPLHSQYRADQLKYNALWGGKTSNDDFGNGDFAAVGLAKRVLNQSEITKIWKWARGKFIKNSLVWNTVVDPVPWSARDGAGLVFMNGALFLVGGWDPTTRNDIWRCDNPTSALPTFTLIRADDQNPPQTGESAIFRPRHAEPVFVHNVNGTNYIYVIGGDNTDPDYANGPPDVWRSKDGLKWERVAHDCPWGQRTLHMACSYKGKLYIFGGQTNPSDATSALKDVWVSEDHGFSWTQLADAPWTKRGIGAVAIFQGKIWMIGGGTNDTNPANDTYFNDVWTFDGTTWTQVLANGHSQFVARKYCNAFVLQGKLWFGCGANASGNVGDLSRTTNGTTWTEFTYIPFGPRHANSWASNDTDDAHPLDRTQAFAFEACGKASNANDTRVFRLARAVY